MDRLRDQTCVACRHDAPKLADDEIAKVLPQVPNWEIIERNSIRQLTRSFPFGDFARALAFTDAVGAIAETEGHHPALLTEWGRTTVTWWTHAIGGLHLNDFIMAAKTDEVYVRYCS